LGASEDGVEAGAANELSLSQAITIMAMFAPKDDSKAAASCLFNAIDVDCGGSLDLSEIVRVAATQLCFCNIITPGAEPLSFADASAEASTDFKKYDDSSDGDLHLDEFAAWYDDKIANAGEEGLGHVAFEMSGHEGDQRRLMGSFYWGGAFDKEKIFINGCKVYQRLGSSNV
jgi:Ca2+-binding EF-hand superfamily protein|tara:strand:- start:1521 stop:2039 length:519 start_codon:yes stop_codon:yes gene_type:complete